MNSKSFFFLLIFVSFFIQINAQTDTVTVTSDTILISNDIPIVKEHKPSRAILLSAVLPGAGQAYNKQYWKIPLFYSALGTTAFTFDYFNKQYLKYKGGIINFNENLEDTTVQILEIFEGIDKTTLTQEKDRFRRNRDLSALVFLAIYTLNIIDATVYAHLANFDVSDDLSIIIQPDVIQIYSLKKQNTIGLSICLKF